ncbi:hypothetical protein [Paenibacillus sp. sgz500992]|uniref:hypothetical protein n=1 Tax=Paenibacillus sp. sgz500992 TaxID=3242476 RepID=UPI0036D2E2F7
MVLYVPGTADPAHVVAGQYFTSKTNYNVQGTLPVKTDWNGDGTSANHHLAKDISAIPGTLWLRPVNPADPITGFQGDVWIQKNEPNLNPAYWRSDVTMFGLQGGIPVRGAGGVVTPGPVPQIKAAGYWSDDITIAAVSVPAGSVRSGVTIAGTAGALPVQATGPQTITPGTSNIVKGPGIYDGAITIAGSPDGIASNIRQDKVINGVRGTLVEGKRSATGTFVDDGTPHTVNGLGFTPASVEVAFSNGSNHTRTGYSYGQWYACVTNSNQTQPMSTNFNQNSVFAGGFTVAVPFGVGYTITWRAVE